MADEQIAETIDLDSLHLDEAPAPPPPPPNLETKVLLGGGFLFFLVSCFALFKSVYDLITASAKAPATIAREPSEELAIVIAAFSVQLIQILIATLAAVIGYSLFRSARTASKQVIPREDRDILTQLIKDEKEKGIDQYIRLSSLIGATGFFTRLGLAGLPLATIGLTLIFTVLSFWGKDYLDLAKLTLGAFIGSYVQRQASGNSGGPTIPRNPVA